MKFSIKDFFSKCDQIRRGLRIWSHLLKKSLMKNLIFCAVYIDSVIRLTQNQHEPRYSIAWSRNPEVLFCSILRFTISIVCDAVYLNLMTVQREGYHLSRN